MDDDVEMEQPSLELRGLTFMMQKMFGEDTVACLKEKYENGIRGFLESTSAVTQCKNAIGDYTSIDVRTGKPHACWICGFEIIEGDESFKPECEHIFPIAQAIMFIGLYREVDVQFLRSQSPDKPVKDVKKSFINAVKAEYGWAHRLCNQVKSDTHFVELKKDSGGQGTSRWDINKSKIGIFLVNILKTSKYGNNKKRLREMIEKSGLTENDWISQRSDAISKRCSEVLSGIKPVNENLALLAAAASLEYDVHGSGCVEEEPSQATLYSTTGKLPELTTAYIDNLFNSTVKYNIDQLRPALATFVTEKLRSARSTPEERMKRASVIWSILELSDASKRVLYTQILNKFNVLKTDASIQPIVLIHELTSFAVYSAFVAELKNIQAKYPDSLEIKKEVDRLEKNMNEIKSIRPQYAARRSKTRRNKKKKGTRRKKTE